MYQVFVLGGDVYNSLIFTASMEAKRTKKCYINETTNKVKKNKTTGAGKQQV